MKRQFRVFAILFMLAALLAPVAVARQATPEASPAPASSFGTLNFLGEQRIGNLTTFEFTLVGGLSGIDYNPATGEWVVISDDRSQHAPARFYTAALDLSAEEGFTGVAITGQTPLRQADGSLYLPDQGSGYIPDPEAIRFDPLQEGTLWWTSEPDVNRGFNPLIAQIDAGGQQIGEIVPPEIFNVDPDGATGSRSNLGFEGLTFSADGETIWVLNESALIQDGPIATVEAGTVTRLIQFDRAGNVLAQYVYELDPIQAMPTGSGADNGVSDILAVDETRFLVIERSGVSTAAGPWNLYIRIYLIDITGATDVSGLESLEGAEYAPVSKELVLNLAETDLAHVDNIEGIAWGPVLENGNATLVLVSDNNFNDTQVTQFLAYEVIP